MNIYDEVKEERRLQDLAWDEQNHNPFVWLAIIGEEFGEACKAAIVEGSGFDDWQPYRKELVQVAASAIVAIESLDRGKWKK